MARLITARMADALRRGAPLALLAQIDHPDGLQRLWTGIGALDYGGYTWTGIGVLGQIAPVTWQSELAIQEVHFVLKGIDPERARFLSFEIRNREALAWLAALEPQGAIVADPLELLNAQLDYQALKVDDDGSATLSLIARSGFYSLERALDEVWSPEDHKRTYPTDTGLDLIHTLANKEVQWTAS